MASLIPKAEMPKTAMCLLLIIAAGVFGAGALNSRAGGITVVCLLTYHFFAPLAREEWKG